MPKKLFLLASLLFATACTGGTGDRSEIRTLSNGETLPAECEICWVDFEACAESGVSIELCEQAVISCAEICEAPLPPVQCDHCFVGYEACVDQAVEGMQDVGDCVAGLESCLGSCEDPEPPLEPCTVVCPTCPQDAECECEVICEPQPEPPSCTGTCEQICDPNGNCETVCWDDCDGGTAPPAPTPAD